MKNRTYYHEFGRDHQKAGFFPTVLSFLLPVLRKIGPLAKLKFKAPSPETEALFVKSFDTTLVHYHSAIIKLNSSIVDLPNRTLDTGHKTVFGEYVIADENYAAFLLRLQERGFAHLSSEIKDNILAFYSGAQPSGRMSRKKAREWKSVQDALGALRYASTIAAR